MMNAVKPRAIPRQQAPWRERGCEFRVVDFALQCRALDDNRWRDMERDKMVMPSELYREARQLEAQHHYYAALILRLAAEEVERLRHEVEVLKAADRA